jgi:hypothetical protein
MLRVEGEKESGRPDSIIISDRQFLEGARYEVVLDDGPHEVRLDRVLRRGRGWVCVACEMLPQAYMCKPPLTARFVPVM